MRYCIGLFFAAAIAVLAGQIAAAQTIGYADAIRVLSNSCGKDIDKHCAKVRLGNNRIADCLAANESKISDGCKRDYRNVYLSLEKRYAAQQSAADICSADINRLCQGIRRAKGYVLRCLLTKRRLSKKCDQVITDAGWR